MIQNSVGTKMFRNNFFESDGENRDVLKGGADSCAYFVSSVLKIFGLIGNIHVTVAGTIKDMLKSGREEYKGKTIPIGAILVWEEKNGHKHVGFYIGGGKAISNSSSKKFVVKHSFDYNGKRSIEKTYVNINIGVNK